MLSTYNLIIDISTDDTSIDQQEFQSEISQSLNHLNALKGAFDRKPCNVVYYPHGNQIGEPGLSARAIVLISVGAKRGESLIQLYYAIGDLIERELSHLKVSVQVSKYDFS